MQEKETTKQKIKVYGKRKLLHARRMSVVHGRNCPTDRILRSFATAYAHLVPTAPVSSVPGLADGAVPFHEDTFRICRDIRRGALKASGKQGRTDIGRFTPARHLSTEECRCSVSSASGSNLSPVKCYRSDARGQLALVEDCSVLRERKGVHLTSTPTSGLRSAKLQSAHGELSADGYAPFQ